MGIKMNNIGDLNEIIRVLIENDDFAIAAHVNPDTDAIGSCLALGLSLKKLGKRVSVFLEPFNEKNLIIPGQELICNTPGEFSVFIALDCANEERLSDPFSILKRAPITISVDHHISHAPFTWYLYLDGSASSTCEMVYRIVTQMLDIDTDIASAIYAGLLTDTGGFMHNCTSSGTMRVVSELLQKGIPFTEIYKELLKRRCIVESNVLRFALNNMVLHENGRAAISSISFEEMDRIGAKATDTDGVSEYMLNIRGVEVSAFLYENTKGIVKASMRSNHVNISETAKAFGGGGHMHAAGCTIHASLAEAYESITLAVRTAVETI